MKPLSHTYGFSYNIYVKLNMNILLETIRELLWFSDTTLVKPLSHTYGFSYNIYFKLNMDILLETIRGLLWFQIQN